MQTIAIIKEGKIPHDNRTPLSPKQCQKFKNKNPGVDVVTEWSAVRCYSDEDYQHIGITVAEDISTTDLLIGIKEVPIDMLIPGKTYMFFSHTHKKQLYNKELLKAILKKNITLIDYELITDEKGTRLLGFGRWAGIIGAHYALKMYGKKKNLYQLKPAVQCLNLQEMVDQYEYIDFPAIKIAITGGGKVANGAIEIMDKAGILEVTTREYKNQSFNHPVFTVLHSEHLYSKEGEINFNKKDFYAHPELYTSRFSEYVGITDVLINAMFWSPQAPRLFEKEALTENFKIMCIADVSCDVDGSVPLTTRVTYSDDPIFGYHLNTGIQGKPYLDDTIDIMAVTNLPNELPKDSSKDFGRMLMKVLAKYVETEGKSPVFEHATIAKNGKLTESFSYLQQYLDQD